MPELIENSEMYLTGSGELSFDTGTPAELSDEAHQRINGTKRFLEAFRRLNDKLNRDAAEQRRRTSQPPVSTEPLPPVTAAENALPQEAPPGGDDTPALQGAPDLAIAPEDVVALDTTPQSSQPLVSTDQPSHTVYDPLNPIAPEDIVNLLAAPPADFDAFITRLQRNENEPGERHPSHAAPVARTPVAKGDPVDLFTGAFTINATDLTVPTPLIPIAMWRSYRSGRPYLGPFGYGWDHVYNVYLRQLNDGGFALWTGQLHEEHFRDTGTGLEPESGFTCRMERSPGAGEVFSVHFPGGTQWLFERPAGWSDAERIPLVQILDRHGNAIKLTYGPINRVVSVLDEAGRGLLFSYGSCQLLERVTDHTGLREVRYEHDAEIEHLVKVILPATGQYPNGFSTTYEYAGYDSHPAMRHNILRILDAEDRLVVENQYAGPDAGWEFNSVVRQRTGGFEYQFGYEQIQYVATDIGNVDVLAARTQVVQPDSSLHIYTFNYRGDLLDHRFRLNRDGSFRVVSRSWQHDGEGNVIAAVAPDGLRTVLTFDSANPDPCARRNLLKVELISPLPDIDPSRIVYRAEYDPRFQLPVRTKDESGAETSFRYDFDVAPFGSTGRLRQVELPAVTGADGVPQELILVFEHNAQGQLTATVSAEQNRTDFLYSSGGLLSGFVSTITRDPSGADLVTAIEYDPLGFPLTVETPGGRKSRFLHNALGQVEEIIAPIISGQDGRVRRFFDDSGYVVRLERPVGSYQGAITGASIVDEYVRDEVGSLRRTLAASNTADRRELLYRVDHEGRFISFWDPLGIRTDRSYGEDGALLNETAAASESEAQTVSYFYDRSGRLTRAVDVYKRETSIEYDVWGRPHKMTLPLGAVWTLEYGVNDRLLEERLEEHSAGTVTLRQRQTYEYDRLGRLIFATRFSFRDDPTIAVPLTARYLYDKDNRLREMMLPQGTRYRYAYDTAGRLSEVIDLHGNIRRFVYGLTGDLIELVAIESQNGVASTAKQLFEHDARGRLVRSTLFEALSELQYDDRNLPIEHRSPNGVTCRVRFNAHGQLVEKVEDPAGLGTRSKFEYDLNGRLIRYVDPVGRITRWDRDAIGRTTTLTPPDGAPWKYVFDDKTRSTKQRTPAGNEVVYQLVDTSVRSLNVTAFATPGQTPVPPRELVFDGLGRLVGASMGTESIQRQYDSLGRLIEETAQGKTVRIEYDDTVGSMDLIYPDGRRERTESNSAGQPTRLTLVTPGVLGGISGDVLLEIHYSPAGCPDHLVYGNGVEASLVHDDNDRIIRIEYRMNGVQLDSCRLRYDENGHRALVQYLGSPTRNLIHDFDRIGRLVEVRTDFPLPPLADQTAPTAQTADVKDARVAAVAAPGVTFILDGADARTERKDLDGTNEEKYILGSDHRVLAVGPDAISYNLDGYRTMDSRYIYQLDALNRVSIVRDRVTNAILTELKYDALSRVSAGSTDGQDFERWFAGDTQIHETSGAGSKTTRQHSAHPLWVTPFCVTDAAGAAFMHQARAFQQCASPTQTAL